MGVGVAIQTDGSHGFPHPRARTIRIDAGAEIDHLIGPQPQGSKLRELRTTMSRRLYSSDIWGGLRTPAEERYDSALVALDVATGKLRWSFQNVHHDLWDMDMPSQPSLVDLRDGGNVVPAIYIPAKTGDIFVVGTESGRVRALVDDKGKQIKQAGPSLPVEVLGLGGIPMAGDKLTVVENEQRAREVAAYRKEKATEKRTTTAPANLETMFSALKDKETVIEFPLVVKADVQGSAEAIVTALVSGA